jgi:hypothetical protein
MEVLASTIDEPKYVANEKSRKPSGMFSLPKLLEV